MPAVTSGKVLVTGANGYIAVWLVQKLLEQGYSVRGTIRSPSRAKYLENLFSKYGDKFELVIVEDITKDGAFDEAVKGVDAIEHTASPFHFAAVDPSEIIGPAVAGTKSILESARKYGTNVKRVVVTSSVAAILNTLPNPTVFNEENWNTTAVEDCEKNGKDASPFSKYRASKTLAERAAWDFAEKHKGSLSWDLTVINPPFVYGPFLHEVTTVESLNQSLKDWYNTVIKADKDDKALVAGGSGWIDVRDTALAHVLALQAEAAGGQRILVNSGKWVWQDWVATAHKIDNSLHAGNTSHNPETAAYMISYDASKAERILGHIKYIDMEQCTRDILAQFKERGWY